MLKKLVITLAAVISISSIVGGGWWLGNTAYSDGIHDGIRAVIRECAQHDSTFYDGQEGNVMLCQGGHMSAPQQTPGKALPEPSSPIQAPGSIPPNLEDKQKAEEL